jgi:DNA-directed RNA polymerase alpha subunit
MRKQVNKRPKDGFLALLSAPASRAMVNAGIRTLSQLSKYSEKDILTLHGIGKTTIPILKQELNNAGLGFSE